MRFRYSGTIPRRWRVSAAIQALGEAVEVEWPDRRPQDGTVASSGHAKWPTSDHGPDPDGIVRAIDVGIEPELFEVLLLNRDPRIKYVIHGREMFSSYPAYGFPPFTRRPYTKGHHDHHTHVSALKIADNDSEPWEIGESMAQAVEGIQRNLNTGGFADPPLDEDGKWGPKTEAAHLAMVKAAAKSPTVELDVVKVNVVKGVKIT